MFSENSVTDLRVFPGKRCCLFHQTTLWTSESCLFFSGFPLVFFFKFCFRYVSCFSTHLFRYRSQSSTLPEWQCHPTESAGQPFRPQRLRGKKCFHRRPTANSAAAAARMFARVILNQSLIGFWAPRARERVRERGSPHDRPGWRCLNNGACRADNHQTESKQSSFSPYYLDGRSSSHCKEEKHQKSNPTGSLCCFCVPVCV